MKFKGIFVALGTPLTADETVDEVALRRLTRFVVSAGVQGVMANGSMGGFACLSNQNQVRAISIVSSEVDGKVPVFAGIGETGTRRAVERVREAISAGANYLVILPPYFYRSTQAQLESFYTSVADLSQRPVLIYDNPVRTHCSVEPETVNRIRLHTNVIGIKESDPSDENLQRLLELTGEDPDFSVLTGSETHMLTHLQMGCSGSIGGLHNVCPHLVVACYEAFQQQDWAMAQHFQAEMRKIAKIFEYGEIWGGFSEALATLGIECETGGAPYGSTLSEAEKRCIREVMAPYISRYSATEPTSTKLEKASG